MRYEDASHTGTFQGSQPIANDDLDSLPAGSKTPATGNLISGEGTQSGSAGADIAPGAHVAAIAGKSGEDTSFSGGKLSVSGEHGRLSVDAEGNYIYQANAGVENVRDRFTYTLADNNGATDTGALIVEIGKTPVVIKANAQQIVPGPDGVVTLPPGVELSDIRVVGRNLVVDMPDGTQLIIIDGAIFVPQLVLNGVEIPSTNLAALLIGQEPQPAAGEAPQSGGGNFAVPPPPLDPGVPLGDLIPPTEYDYTPPEPEEVFDILDREPSGFALDILVDDDTLPGGQAGGIGDGPDAVNVTGFFAALGSLGGDGPLTFSLELTGAPGGFAFVSGGPGVVFIQQNGITVRTITFDPATGEYEVTQNAPIQHPPGGDENDFVIVLTVTVTDQDGDTATGTVTITLDDDTPTARNDTDAVPDGADSTDGNVLTGVNTTSGSAGSDTPGADDLPDGVTGIHAGTSGSFTAVTGGGVNVAGTFGTLLINSDGSYTYTLSGNQGAGGTDVFTYQIIDGDGDVSTATLTIVVPPDSIPEPNNATAIVDDDGLPNGNNDSAPGDDVVPNNDGDNNETTFSGTLTADFGGDGPGTFTLAAMNNQTQVVGQETVRYTWNDATDTLTAVVEGGARDGLTLFTVELNPNGEFEVTLVNNVLQVDDGTNTENNATAVLTFTATDSDSDSTNATLTITFDDDIPTAIVPPPPPQGEPQEPLLSGLVDEDALLPDGNNDSAPGDDPGGTTASGAAGSLGALFNAGADQPLAFSLSGDTSGLPNLTSNGVPVTYAVVDNVLTASAGGTDVFTLTVNADGSWEFELVGQLDHPTAGTEDNLLLDLSSVIVATDDDGDEATGAPGAFVIDVDDDLPTANEGQVTGTVDEDGVVEGIADGGEGDGIAGGTGDAPGAATVASGSVAALFNSGADVPLSFGFAANAVATLQALGLTSNGVDLEYQVVGDTITASTAAGDVFTFELDADGNWEFTLIDQLDHAEGNDENDLEINLGNIIEATDADGDSVVGAADGLVITVDDDTPTASEAQVTGTVDEDGVVEGAADAGDGDGIAGGTGDVPGAATVATGSVAALFSSGADAPLSYGFAANAVALLEALNLTSNGVDLEYQVVGDTITASTAAGDVFTFELQADGDWEFTLIDQLDHAEGNDENDLEINLGNIIEATDADGDSVVGAADGLVITVDDDTPVARADEDTVPSGGDIITGNVITGANTDTGAAGADSTGADAPASVTGLVSFNVPANVDNDPAGGGFIVDGEFGQLTLQPDGSYSYDRFGGSPGDVDDVFTYSYTDADGDTVTTTLTIHINDSAPTLDAPPAALVDDDDVLGAGGNPGGVGDNAPANTSGGLAGLVTGGDGDIDFFFATTQPALPLGFTHNLVNSTTMQILQGATVVLTITLNNETGAYSIVQNNPVDHAAGGDENNLGPLNVGFVAIDENGTGDESNVVNLSITVDDDTPVATATQLTGTVDEDGVLEGAADAGPGDGIAGGTGDVGGAATVASGSVATLFSAGADQPLTFDFAANAVATLEALNLSSNGVALDYAIVGDIITASTAAGDVFTFELNDNGDWEFTLIDQLDHAAGNNENDLTINLSGIIEATDFDGDSVVANANGLVITVDDDTPIATATQLTGTVDEDGVLEGAADAGPGDGIAGGTGDVGGAATVASGSASTMFQSGADAPLSFSFAANAVATLEALNLTSNGVDLDYAIVGDIITASTAAGDVFTFELNDNGDWEFTLIDQLDHAAGNDENDLTINLGAIIQAADFDGDSVVGNANGLVITVDDDSPTLGEIEDGTASNTPGDATSSGELNFEVGADAPATVVNITADNTGITSGGKGLVTSLSGNVLTAYQDTDGDGIKDAGETTEVYTLTVNPDAGADGEWVFDLITPLDPTVVDTPIGGSTSFGAGPTGFQVLDDGGGNPLCVVSGYNVNAGFNQATWLASGSTAAANLDSGGVNGSTSGWGIDNNNFDGGEFFNWDFGPQAPDDPDGPGPFVPPANPGMPNISFATFEFIGYGAGDEMYVVVHYTDGTFDSQQVPPADVDAGLWTFNADPGKFIADIEMFTPDAAPGKVDLVSVGVTSSDLDETIDFDVTLSDSDGDQVSGGFSVNVADGNTPSMALLAQSPSQEQQLQKTAANSNTLTLAAAVAAAGMVESQAAAAPAHDNGNRGHQVEEVSSGHQFAASVSSDDNGSSSAVSSELPEAANDSAPVESSSRSSDPAQSDHSLDDGSAKADDQSSAVPTANDQGPASSSVEASPAALAVGMPSVEALQAAGVAGNAQQGGSVEQIVAEALGQGNATATVDALLNALPGGNGAVGALANLASPAANAVPGGDMLGLGAFAPGHDMMFNVHAAMQHHDAVQPVANG